MDNKIKFPQNHIYGILALLSAASNNPDIIFGLLKREIQISDENGIFTEMQIEEAASAHIEQLIGVFNAITDGVTFEEIDKNGITLEFGDGGEDNPFDDIDFGDFYIGLN